MTSVRRKSLFRTFDNTQIVPVIFFIFEFQWDNHQFKTILTLKALSGHKTNIGIDTDSMASNTDSKRHKNRLGNAPWLISVCISKCLPHLQASDFSQLFAGKATWHVQRGLTGGIDFIMC